MKWLEPYHLNSTERKGLLAFAVLLGILLIVKIALLFWPEAALKNAKNLENQLALFESQQKENLRVAHAFDPNLVDSNFVYSLAISQMAAENWLRFLARGRNFKTPEDLKNIYGLDSLWYAVNADSVHISTKSNLPASKKFFFDPNTATAAQLELLGIPDFLVKNIINYRGKGGQFKVPEDVKKIYNFPEDLYQNLAPYIQIAPKTDLNKTDATDQKPFVKVELNTADSLQLITVKGIGPAFAGRILAYRNKLGGFATMAQLGEVYGLDAEKVAQISEQITLNKTLILQLKINTAPFKVLVAHPYLNYDQVKQIVNYREKIGPIKKVSDLVQLPYFSENDISKLAPYLSVE